MCLSGFACRRTWPIQFLVASRFLIPARPAGRGAVLTGVIAAARAHLKFLVAFRLGIDLDRAITAGALRRIRLIPDSVLVAYVVCDLRSNRIDLAQVLGEEGHAASLLCHHAKRAPCPLGMLFLQQADGVNRWPIFRLQP